MSSSCKLNLHSAGILLCAGALLGSLTFSIWRATKDDASLRNEVRELRELVENSNTHFFKGNRQAVNSLKRPSRQASEPDTLTGFVQALIRTELLAAMECNKRDTNNSTECTLKPGPKGEKGSTGQSGQVGFKGEMGVKGPQGRIGERGRHGDKGSVGQKGAQGTWGEKGDTGAPGEKGICCSEEQTGTQTIDDMNVRVTDAEPVALPSETCGGTGWRRVAFINMTDPNQVCPQGLSLTGYSIRSCGRAHTEPIECSSVIFPVGDYNYTQVCGRAIGYRHGLNYGFFGYHGFRHDIEKFYVDGLSLTYGSPREHIWTFASGGYNGASSDGEHFYRCPCDPGSTYGSPPFLGSDFFCDSVVSTSEWSIRHFSTNALWDGQDLLNPCYGFNDPPWFNKTLPVTTTDDIELRLCLNAGSGRGNIGISLLEVYVY